MRASGFVMLFLGLAFGLTLLSGCTNGGQVPNCILGCTAVYEHAIGGDLGDVSLSRDRRVRR